MCNFTCWRAKDISGLSIGLQVTLLDCIYRCPSCSLVWASPKYPIQASISQAGCKVPSQRGSFNSAELCWPASALRFLCSSAEEAYVTVYLRKFITQERVITTCWFSGRDSQRQHISLNLQPFRYRHISFTLLAWINTRPAVFSFVFSFSKWRIVFVGKKLVGKGCNVIKEMFCTKLTWDGVGQGRLKPLAGGCYGA